MRGSFFAMARIIIGGVPERHSARAAVNPEARWRARVALLGIGGVMLALPHKLVFGPRWLVLALVVALLVPTTILLRAGRHRWDRILGYAISIVVTMSLMGSLLLLILRLP